MRFDSLKHDFNFGQKNVNHMFFIYEKCMICFFFINKNTNLR